MPLQKATLEQGPMGFGPLRVLKVLKSLLIIQLTFQLQVMNHYNIMCVAALTAILQRIRSISQQFDGIKMPGKIENLQNPQSFDSYIQTLDQIQAGIIRSRNIEEEYSKLQVLLQQEEALNRKKIGFQQQMRLYCESLKAHIHELEIQKTDLLENSKTIIKDLKRVNEKLYLKASVKGISNGAQNKKKANPQVRGSISDGTRALSLKKSQRSCRLDEIKELGQALKTEFIERNIEKPLYMIQKVKKRNKRASNFSIFQKIREQVKVFNVKQNSNTYQILEPKTDRELPLHSKKKHKRLKSNLSLCSYSKQHRKEQEEHLKSCYLKNSHEKPKLKERLKIKNRSAWKERSNNNNRSVESVDSMCAATSVKQTL